MAGFIGLGERLVEWYHVSGLLHDLGKVAVPEAVLCKPGQLTEDEIAIVRRHPEIGYRILKDIAPIREALPGVLYHHERVDGSGYHRGAGAAAGGPGQEADQADGCCRLGQGGRGRGVPRWGSVCTAPVLDRTS